MLNAIYQVLSLLFLFGTLIIALLTYIDILITKETRSMRKFITELLTFIDKHAHE